MGIIKWNNEKNEWLKEHRGVSFEQVVILMERGDILDVVEHSNQREYRGQLIAVVEIDKYAYLVPYVQNGNDIFLKTIIPSRKATEEYVRKEK
jgi:uncharacterized DUF497 family protein